MDDFPRRSGDPSSKWSPEEIEAAIQLLELSETVAEAAEKIGITSSSLRDAFRRRGMPSPSCFLESNSVWGRGISSSPTKQELSWKTHFVIPDSHAKPGISNDRYEWLGHFIVEHRPDVVINLGDMADMESLSSYDRGKKSFEGRRYRKDIESVINAQKRFFEPINKLNEELEAQGKPLYKPRFVMTLGNHEDRINRIVNDSPELDGILSVGDLQYEEFGWEVYPYMDRVVVDGIAYSHCFASGVMNRPIGGEHAAAALVKKHYMSCTAGHSHLRDFAERTRADGVKIQGMVAGCYFEHQESYASTANLLWWRGVVLKHHVQEGQYEPQFLSIENLKHNYGRKKIKSDVVQETD
mgnify:FL=1|tara:strand:- start:6969 stop:8030 length:1062 start_codon:yes stop_codon:yes gene_type:complete